jgi:hypothetical protein
MKIFEDANIQPAPLRKLICKVAKERGVKRVIFNGRSKHVRGTYNAETKVMFLDLNQSSKELLVTFLHELGHHTAVVCGLWLAYHLNQNPNESPEERFNIENNIDQIAESLWNQIVDTKQWGKYKYVYPKTHKKNLTAWLGTQ